MHHYNIEILNLFHPEIQLINTNPDIEHKLNELLSDSKKFKVWTVLVLGYNKWNDRKIIHSSAKLIARDSDIDEAFISMHQIIVWKVNIYTCESWIDLDVIIKHNIKIFEC